MKASKLINILKTFSKEEIKQFEKFVSSPFHNTSKNNQLLIRELKRFYPAFDSGNLSYEYLYKKIYPGKKFNRQMMWNLASGSERLAEDFLAILRFKNNEFEMLRNTVSEYSERNLHRWNNRKFDKMRSYLKKSVKDNNYFFYKAMLESYKKAQHHFEDKQHLLCENVLKEGEYLIIVFLENIVSTINDLYANSAMYNANYDVNVPIEFVRNLNLKGLAEYVKRVNYEHSYLIETYCYSILLMLQADEEENFVTLRRLFEENRDRYYPGVKLDVAASLVNYCTHKITNGNTEYKRILFELYKYLLRDDMLLFPYNRLPQILYVSILKCAININETDWAKDFIEKHTPLLKQEFQSSVKSLALALLKFHRKEYEGALRNLNGVDFSNPKDKVIVKVLTAQIYFEMGETELLMYNIDSTRQFLNRNKFVGEVHKKSYINFYSYLLKLISLRENGDKFSMLSNEINNANVYEKSWLVEKLEELETK